MTTTPGSSVEIGYEFGPLSADLTSEFAVSGSDGGHLGVGGSVGVEASPGEARLSLSADHRARLRAVADGLASDQRMQVGGRLAGLEIAPGVGITVDLATAYTASPFDPDLGEAVSSASLAGLHAGGFTVDTDIRWHAARSRHGRDWLHDGEVAARIARALGPAQTVSLFGRLEPVAGGYLGEAGLDLELGAHALRVSQRLGGGVAVAPATSSVYSWRVGPVGVSLKADYTAGTITAPSSFFAGLAVVLGGDLPSPDALLAALN